MKVKRVVKAKAVTTKEVKELSERLDALQETVTRIGNALARAVEFQARVTVLETAQVEMAKRLEKVEATLAVGPDPVAPGDGQ